MLKYHGGKQPIAGRIRAMFPPHLHYVEPYAGGLAVLLAGDGEGVSEVVNDLDGDVINFWRVLRDDFPALHRALLCTPVARAAFDEAGAVLRVGAHSVPRAAAFFTHCRLSLAGRRRGFSPLSRNRTRRGMNEQASAWWAAIAGLEDVHARLSRVVIECDDALRVIRREDGLNTLFYCDPPYVKETRVTPEVYTREMSGEDHEALLRVLLSCKGRVILSGYRCEMYDDMLASWPRTDMHAPNRAGDGRRVTESLWSNWR